MKYKIFIVLAFLMGELASREASVNCARSFFLPSQCQQSSGSKEAIVSVVASRAGRKSLATSRNISTGTVASVDAGDEVNATNQRNLIERPARASARPT
jgi:hypothetical protein